MVARVGLVVTGGRAEDRARLTESIERYNTEGLTVLVDPQGTSPVAPILTLWQTNLLDVYVVIDPRTEFLRPFNRSDFMVDDETPFTVVSEESELRVEGLSRALDADRAAVSRVLDLRDQRTYISRGLAVLSATALESFSTEFLRDRGWDYAAAVRTCPNEFAWYTAWVQASRVIPFVPREPLVAMADSQGRLSDYAVNGVNNDDLARAYLGVVRDESGPLGRVDVLAERLTVGELASAVIRRSTRKAPTVQRWLGLSVSGRS